MAIYNFGPWETKSLPVLDPLYPSNVAIEAGYNATFSVRIEKDGKPKEYAYQWYENGSAVKGATSSTYIRTTTKNDGGNYLIYCKVTHKSGTVTSRTATLSVGDSSYRVPKFSYSGSYFLGDNNGNQIEQGSLTDNWYLVFLTGGTLRFSELGNAINGIDVFLCGGGGSGGYGHGWCSGGGGGGGYTTTKTVNVSVYSNYQITIGGGGGSTSAFGHTAAAGGNGGDSTGGENDYVAGGEGTGYGGRGANISNAGGNGGDGVKAFNTGSILYGAGGGGGANGNGYGYGGKTGGGNGATDVSWIGEDGQANTGGGGGGAGNNSNQYGGSGGSGIVIIRNKR